MSSLIVGSNSDYYADIKSVVPGLSGRRVYYDSVAQGGVVPTVWPSSFSGDQVVLSIRPRMFQDDTTNEGPWLINNGWTKDSWTLNPAGVDPIKQLISSAGPDQDLTIWHEAGNFYTEQQQPWMFGTNAMRVAHKVMQSLCTGTGVSYGVIMCMPPGSMGPWIPDDMNLDWYGLDIYDWYTSGTACGGDGDFRFSGGALDLALLTDRLAAWQSEIQGITGETYPKLNVCETNSPCSDHQGKWFTSVGDWLAGHGGHRMLTYWSESGSASTPWTSRGGDVVSALNALE